MNESPMGERELDTAPTSSPKLWPAEEDAEARPVSARSPKAREENVARHMPQAGFLERQMGRVAKHANKKDEVRNHKGVSKPRLFA